MTKITRETEGTQHPGAKIWIVDDDQELLDCLQELITAQGWKCRCLPDTKELNRLLQEETPNILILDRLLRNENGLSVLEELRTNGNKFPVLMVSALGSPNKRIEGLSHGAIDYMAKPFLWRELQLRIERILDFLSEPRTDRQSTAKIYYINDCIEFDACRQTISGPMGRVEDLTTSETATLQGLCLSPKVFITRENLFLAARSSADARTSRSLDMRISKLRRMLNQCLEGSGKAIESLRGTGYRLNAKVNTRGSGSIDEH